MNISDLNNFADTLSVCYRNAVADITFYDQNNFILTGKLTAGPPFPFEFIERSRSLTKGLSEVPVSSLRNGIPKIQDNFNEDWMVFIFIAIVVLYLISFSFSKNTFPELSRFFSYKGPGDELSRDSASVFSWQSAFLNLASFLSLGLFSYFCLRYLIPAFKPESSFISCLLLSAAITAAVTLRHLTCTATGIASRQKKIFDEYTLTVYLAYRYPGLIIFILSALISYTRIVPVKYLVISGLIVFFFFYLLRLLRLSIIFVSRSVSILYLILYLCALEFLPVLISVKYLTGLF